MTERPPGDYGGKVTSIEEFRRRRRIRKAVPPATAAADFDAVTRDLHAAASVAMKMIFLVRSTLGLPPL